MLVFVLIGAAGLVLLLLSLVVGELLDLGDGALSGTSLGVGAVVFGAVGAIVTVNELSLWVAYAASAVVGLLAAGVAQLMIRRLSATEDNANVSLVGVQGTAVTDITQAAGEVSLDAVSELERRLAWSLEPIAEGTRVVVLEHQPNSVRVGPYRPEA
ncbi:NfeD-like partner-binding protein [Isoptericola sp. CG 20/1183]|uniref:NfeD-like partner-binding protein n=1 Tax=Isoptericola halotolerans TaxID=300560 RepID=A0ABX5EHV4_9MICO|nr:MULTISPECIES: NfeD family protein [Isoptericola]PRZ04115.1 NfeD-like partner-binding protein [Isoptericola sp. CG 20/1183]PRZ10060.1 NfeD-like partner-binding protein [Isoptericola halotolerans]